MTPNAPKRVVHDGSQSVQTIRDTDANVLQRRAASPESSVWVGASAGSGKTKVLTDRVLRLLLPRSEHQPGTPPHKILCITFTKAAASEMSLRITRTLGAWAVLGEEELVKALEKLLGRLPQAYEIKAARRLFAEVADAPGGLQIMTIHSFCQSVLGRFPLEAKLPPHFTVLEERQAQIMLTQARDAVFAAAHKSGPLADAIHRAASVVNDEDFLKLIKNLGSERYQLQNLLENHFGAEGLYAELCQTLNVQAGQLPADIILEACKNESFDAKNLKIAAQNTTRDKAATRAAMAAGTLDWLALTPQNRAAKFDEYCSFCLTQKGRPNGTIFKPNFNITPDGATLLGEAERLVTVKDAINAAQCAALTRDMLQLGQAILDTYQKLKLAKGALDFDDLIIETLRLLQQDDMAAWVLYKLDQGLDHILIDEAQDTNPEQWDIALTLAEEFFAGLGARKNIDRTTFTVGDRKQSIYSFQRASPRKFAAAREQLKTLVQNARKDWQDVPVNISFRSTRSVLKAVDSTFADPLLRKSLNPDEAIEHISAPDRNRQAGLVELWPIFETPDAEKTDPWDPPVTVIERQTGAAKLADALAKEIQGWIENKVELPSRNRSIRPEDILILVRSRNAFVPQLARALKTHGIPVSGVDRMILNEQLPVQDMLALAEFALLPTDDLTLATILKCPVIGWNDDTLYKIAADRAGSLWDELLQAKTPEIPYLGNLIDMAGTQAPYEFFSGILQRSCPADSISGLRAFKARLGPDAIDPLDELLNAALDYGQDNIPSLQGFLRWQSTETTGLKREMDEARSEVRIMTVHGSKGLQAPIVILPDTIRSATGGSGHTDRRLLWPDKTGLPTPIWCPKSDMEPAAFTAAKARFDELQAEESHRLLYVAMTRAEDRLYVAGYRGKAAPRPDSWYFAIQNGLKSLPDTETTKDGRLRLQNGQIGDADKAHKKTAAEKPAVNIPDWLRRPAPAEPSPPRPLVPSRPSEAETPVFSPLANEVTHRFRRGNLTHKLLQFLPELPLDKREQAARTYIERYGRDLPENIRDGTVDETLKVLDHPDFAPIFGPGSQAEVPITGLINGRVVSGQIDRLLVTDSEILIVDYKTNRPPPTDPKNVPQIYYSQMRAYADTMRAIYPGRAIKCALLWTDGTRLMELKVA